MQGEYIFRMFLPKWLTAFNFVRQRKTLEPRAYFEMQTIFSFITRVFILMSIFVSKNRFNIKNLYFIIHIIWEYLFFPSEHS